MSCTTRNILNVYRNLKDFFFTCLPARRAGLPLVIISNREDWLFSVKWLFKGVQSPALDQKVKEI